jgi:adenine-specific DNA-methyltransferase
MAPRKSSTQAPSPVLPEPVADYRYDAPRKNIPPAGLAAQGRLEEPQRIRYEYNPHRPPVLRFDPVGAADRLPELIAMARKRALTEEEARLLADALHVYQPWLEWASKREKSYFEVEPVALHIHERIAAQAIVKVAARQDVQRDMFAEPKLSYREAVQFYQHPMDWANRMILGDSLYVMASLARREDLAGKVQMIYVDPPYGIKFASNFQPEVGKRDVKDKESDLTREPEMVKAYRDTWTLGVHSYLAYLRDRLWITKELLADTGSIFVQISDENLHRVRLLMDEVFRAENFVTQVTIKKTTGSTADFIPGSCDYLLWYAKDRVRTKFRALFEVKRPGDQGATGYSKIELPSGERRALSADERDDLEQVPYGAEIFAGDNITSQSLGRDKGEGASSWFKLDVDGFEFTPGLKARWKTNEQGMRRLKLAERLIGGDRSTLSYKRKLSDFPVSPLLNIWTDTVGQNQLGGEKLYVVQTALKIVERCLLMTTDPGDLVLDPTCGSGTTAYVAEQWGRRWITIDTSRVALALARQRLMTAEFDYYELRPLNDEDCRRNPNGAWLSPSPPASLSHAGEGDREAGGEGRYTLDCESVPHITLKSIAQNAGLDPIFARHRPILDERLVALNAELANTLTPSPSPASGRGENLRQKLAAKLVAKQKAEGKRAITEADRRRWLLPPSHRDPKVKLTVDAAFPGWYEWEVPFDADPDWPPALAEALAAYRAAWRAKMDEVNAAIVANAENEELVDRPRVKKGVVRVSGPFTMEAVMPAECTLHDDSPIEGVSDELDGFTAQDAPANAEAFLDKMIRLLAQDGVRFPNNKVTRFERLSTIGEEFLHAEGEWVDGEGRTQTVAISVGPEFGPVTAYQVENALHQAARRGYASLVLAGFSFDAAAQAIIQDDPNPRVRCHLAHIRPDVNMNGLLKETPNAQLFTVFGSPRTRLERTPDGLYTVTLEGVDIYNPVENTILATSVEKVAAWFIDSDYDGRTFCITQAFFPDKSAWEKLARALKAVVDESAFAALSGTTSLPFAAGEHKRVAVKVIDPRGNEVMRVHRLDGSYDG